MQGSTSLVLELVEVQKTEDSQNRAYVHVVSLHQLSMEELTKLLTTYNLALVERSELEAVASSSLISSPALRRVAMRTIHDGLPRLGTVHWFPLGADDE